ncbi:MAG: IS200/IS605 family transposase [Euryarchaeota archaeon]|nr:IS200/IS605 family transposase [Euryarchaeota archaeon]
MSSDALCMERKELHPGRHTVSLLTGHMVFSPKYRGKILVGDIVLALDSIIRKTCKSLGIEIIDMAVNSDHVHLFTQYPPKYSVSYIAKRIIDRSSRTARKHFHTSRNGAVKVSGHHLASMVRLVMGGRLRERYIQNQEMPNAKSLCTGSVLKSGV